MGIVLMAHIGLVAVAPFALGWRNAFASAAGGLIGRGAVSDRPSPLCNRVTPYGERIAVPDRGLFWGNRGSLHDDEGSFVRYSRGKGWVTCLLEFHGRHRQLLSPGRLSELFFLDEATAFAAGHRPCGECRHRDYLAFKSAWFKSQDRAPGDSREMDEVLHADRLAAPGEKRMHPSELGALPRGAVVDVEGEAWLVGEYGLLHWTPGGYDRRRQFPSELVVSVLTPRSTVAAIRQGYAPIVHPSAAPLDRRGPFLPA